MSAFLPSKQLPGKGGQLLRLGLLWLGGMMVTTLATMFILHGGAEPSQKALRIAMILQDMLVWIMPAIVCALMCSRVPADWLSLRRAPSGALFVGALAVMFVSIPAQNTLIAWNEGVVFPEPLQSIFMAQEQAAAGMVGSLMEGSSVGSLVMGILIVGVMAGLSEELFFRGALLRICSRGTGYTHVAVWVVAFVFSLIHFQAFGFVPRLLLGAWFGYLLLWSGSLWLPIAMHVLNNSLATLSEWLVARGVVAEGVIESMGVDSPWVCWGSVAATFVVILAMKRYASRAKIRTFAQI